MSFTATCVKGTAMIAGRMLKKYNATAETLLSLIRGTDSSREAPQTFQQAWWHADENERQLWRDAIEKEFRDMQKGACGDDIKYPKFQTTDDLSVASGCFALRMMDGIGRDFVL